MAAKRYAVLNSSGVVVNHIRIDDPMPKDYWPGYGRWLLCLDGTPTATAPGIPRLTITPSTIPQIGDTVDTSNGNVTKRTVTTFSQMQLDGVARTVASAPIVVLSKDIEPSKT